MSFHPYLYFGGNCREAFDRYREIFGGELTVMTGADAPPGTDIPAGKGHLVMHAALMVDGAPLMASDSYDDDVEPAPTVAVHYSTTDVDHARRVFDALAEGGTVQMAGGETFWTPFYGSCIDRFGISWQVNVEADEAS